MNTEFTKKNYLGISGLGRIGKLNLWNHLIVNHFDGYVVNVGREVGKSIDAVIQAIETDSTYGSLSDFIYGHSGKKCEIKVIDAENYILDIDGKYLKILRRERNPKSLNWGAEGVRLVVDCTGKYLDPSIPADAASGSVRGHLEAGAEKVIISSPFKIKDSSANMPEDSSMFVFGINHNQFDKAKHHIISAASCTTTALAHMMKPLIETKETADLLTASMSTIHATTNSQSILDSMPNAGAGDLRKTRSVLNNIILTSTGAAKALEKILPDIQRVGFMADSVRVPVNTASLITLNITFQSPMTESGEPVVNRNFINQLYKAYSEGPQKDLLVLSQRQNVSSDFIGREAAVTIEGCETHTRTGFIALSAETLQTYGIREAKDVQIPVTHAKIFGWYDNEYGSYVNALSKLTIFVDKMMS